MTDPEISAKLAELEKLCGEATPGPWYAAHNDGPSWVEVATFDDEGYHEEGPGIAQVFTGEKGPVAHAWKPPAGSEPHRINAKLIAASRSLLPAFVALLKEGFSLHRLCDVPQCFEGGPASVLPHCVTCGTSFAADSFWPCLTRLSLEKALETP